MRNRLYNVDLEKSNYEVLKFKQYDNNIALALYLTSGGLMVDTTGYTVTALFKRRDGKIYRAKCTNDGPDITTILHNDVLGLDGKVHSEFRIFHTDGHMVTTFNIPIFVERSIACNIIDSAAQEDILDNIVGVGADIKDLKQEIEQARNGEVNLDTRLDKMQDQLDTHKHHTDEVISLRGYVDNGVGGSLQVTDTLNEALSKLENRINLGGGGGAAGDYLPLIGGTMRGPIETNGTGTIGTEQQAWQKIYSNEFIGTTATLGDENANAFQPVLFKRNGSGIKIGATYDGNGSPSLGIETGTLVDGNFQTSDIRYILSKNVFYATNVDTGTVDLGTTGKRWKTAYIDNIDATLVEADDVNAVDVTATTVYATTVDANGSVYAANGVTVDNRGDSFSPFTSVRTHATLGKYGVKLGSGTLGGGVGLTAAGSLEFCKDTTGTGTLTTVRRFIFAENQFSVNANNTVSCGGPGLGWSAVYATNGTIQTSDMKYKSDIRDIDDGIFFDLIKNTGVHSYVLNYEGMPENIKQEYAPQEQIHVGVIAQEMAQFEGNQYILNTHENEFGEKEYSINNYNYTSALHAALKVEISKREKLEYDLKQLKTKVNNEVAKRKAIEEELKLIKEKLGI